MEQFSGIDPTGGSHVEDGVVEHPTADDFGHARVLPEDRTWFKRAVFYEVLVRAFYDASVGRIRRSARTDRTTRLSEVAWRGLPLAAAVLRLPAARRRLRHPRLLQGAAGLRHGRGLRGSARRRPPAWHPGHHRPGHESHLGLARLVPGIAPRPRRALRRLLRVERHQREVHGCPDHLRRHRGVELDLRPGAPAVLLAPVLLTPARPELRQPGRSGVDARRPAVLARPRHRRLPAGRRALPVRARGHQLREPAGDARVPQTLPQGDRRRIPGPGAAGRGQPVAGRRRRVLRRSRTPAATSATWRSISR